MRNATVVPKKTFEYDEITIKLQRKRPIFNIRKPLANFK